jgi:hypothetical protein
MTCLWVGLGRRRHAASKSRCALPRVLLLLSLTLRVCTALYCPALPCLQVSWCKLEVEVDTHKAITSNLAENK